MVYTQLFFKEIRFDVIYVEGSDESTGESLVIVIGLIDILNSVLYMSRALMYLYVIRSRCVPASQTGLKRIKLVLNLKN